MKDIKIKKLGDFLNEEVSWSKILFGKTIKEVFDDIHSEINPVLKLKDEIEKSEKELEEKERIVRELENKLKERINGNK